jgi:hypothetical protein
MKPLGRLSLDPHKRLTVRRIEKCCQFSNDNFWRKAVVRRMGVYGTTAPEYTCVSLRERTSAHFVRLRTPDLRLTFVLD